MKTVDSTQLRLHIEKVHGQNAMAFQDLFAVGCWLHLSGKQTAGRKLIRQVLSSVKGVASVAYIESIADNLEGQEQELADSIFAHYEVNALFESPIRLVTAS